LPLLFTAAEAADARKQNPSPATAKRIDRSLPKPSPRICLFSFYFDIQTFIFYLKQTGAGVHSRHLSFNHTRQKPGIPDNDEKFLSHSREIAPFVSLIKTPGFPAAVCATKKRPSGFPEGLAWITLSAQSRP
jgi:hypothetical protein